MKGERHSPIEKKLFGLELCANINLIDTIMIYQSNYYELLISRSAITITA